MASVKVAVRVRPFNKRELTLSSKCIIEMDGSKTRIIQKASKGKSLNLFKEFTFDYSYWSFDENDETFVPQQKVFEDLGRDVVGAAFEGYNACIFAYGQTGSGKTYTMMGPPENQGLIPRICESLFSQMLSDSSYRVEVSYLEIYNEKVKDLLNMNVDHTLKIREHPRLGPIVENLSKHLVSDYSHIQALMAQGNAYRTTANTNMNDYSSRSHAIFTIMFVQAGICNDLPTETVSKIHLVDLAGSERADATGATGIRLKEGAYINKSLVTLGSVISALAELSFRDGTSQRCPFIPYRDSILTWLLKDSLGGNSKTIMIAAISPSDCSYSETLSTLYYANRAKSIINKPEVNEDPNVKLIRELRAEIKKLKKLMTSDCPSTSIKEALFEKEAQEKVLTMHWADKWKETQCILQEQEALALRKAGTGIVLDSEQPHLICIDDNLLSTGVTLYHLMDGETLIGTEEASRKQHIILTGNEMEPEHCSIILENGKATLIPRPNAHCWVNGCLVIKPTELFQGCMILVGRTNMFRYNDPVEAEKMRKEGDTSHSHLNLSQMSLMTWSPNLNHSADNNITSNTMFDKVTEEKKVVEKKDKEKLRMQKAVQTNEMDIIESLAYCRIQLEKEYPKILVPQGAMQAHITEDAINKIKGSTQSLDCAKPSCSYNSSNSASWNVELCCKDFSERVQVCSWSLKNQGEEKLIGEGELEKKENIVMELLNKISQFRIDILQCLESNTSQLDTDKQIKVFQELKEKFCEIDFWFQDVQRGKSMECPLSKVKMSALAHEIDSFSIQLNPILNSANQSPQLPLLSSSEPEINCQLGSNEEDKSFSLRIPSFVMRGSGGNAHYVYEVEVQAGSDNWAILRRYSQFLDLHLIMKRKYGALVATLDFPPKKLYFRHSECLAKERRPLLESYLQSLISVCSQLPSCSLIGLHKAPSKQLLVDFSSFFKRGVFETGKYATN